MLEVVLDNWAYFVLGVVIGLALSYVIDEMWHKS